MKMKNRLNFRSKGQGKPIVLLHGYLENLTMWTEFANELAKNYQVVAIDLPGHGESEVDAAAHTMEFMAEKVVEVLEALNLQKSMFVGHSMGGYVVLALAELFPEKVTSFVLMNASTLADDAEKKALRLRMVAMVDRNFDLLVKLSFSGLFHDAQRFHLEKETMQAMALSTKIEGVKAALQGMRLRKDHSFVLDEFSGEIGIIHGEFDTIIDVKAFEKVLPKKENISVLTVPSGHLSFIEAAEATLKFIQKMAEK